MFISKLNDISRRAFLKRSRNLACAGAATSYGMGLIATGEAAAFENISGYKALVCVFLDGGNDHANTLIPYDPINHAKYFNIRGNPVNGQRVAFDREELFQNLLKPKHDQTLTDGIEYALSPWMPRMKALFDRGMLAPLLNVGTLEAPITRSQFENGSQPRPAFLFSHNDQKATWMTSGSEGTRTGWGGRMADLAQTRNTNQMFTAINATGNGLFVQGERTAPFRVSDRGVTQFRGLQSGRLFGSSAASGVFDRLLRTPSASVLESDYATMNAESIEYGAFVEDALGNNRAQTDFGSDNELASQLEIVARLIRSRDALSVQRQVFFVSMRGFDTHTDLRDHSSLLGKVDFALDAFFKEISTMGLANQVTTFTASDFGRTLSLNGLGSDHGWGGHHLVLGGAVDGGKFYGKAPKVSLDSHDQVGRGRLLPSTSVDEYSTTLAKWFGVSSSNLQMVQPNIGRFAKPDLGFMSAG
ncbi:MAG: DUF1501 domain-containing protein [Erythrobacter sp.]|uniref:DUF1501 domain-containing protein n=1 Tax=Erythrobacter sp. TaxID=1042 RepID=UPI003267118B